MKFPDAKWAYRDQRGRLVVVKHGDGNLYVADVKEGLIPQLKPIANFDQQSFEDIPSPDWAKTYVK